MNDPNAAPAVDVRLNPVATIRQEDAAIMRECLAWLHKRVPPVLQAKINKDLRRYADKLKMYCGHPQSVFVQKENAYACLDCGVRFQIKN